MLKAEQKPLTDKEKEKLQKQREKEKKAKEREKRAKEKEKRLKEKEKKAKERERKQKEKEKKAKEREKKMNEKEKASKDKSKQRVESKTVESKTKTKKSNKNTIEKNVKILDSKTVNGELVGKVYDVHDSPMAQVLMTKGHAFIFSSSRTGRAVESKNLGELTRTLYLSVTDGDKFLNIRWARNDRFDIRNYTRPWRDPKPNWSASESVA